jgi:plastocyanin
MQMTSYSWASPVSGDWNTGTLWSSGIAPNDVAADVTISAETTLTPNTAPYTITISSGESITVDSLIMNNTDPDLAGSNSSPYTAAELTLDGTLAFGPTSAGTLGGSLADNGSLQTFIFTDPGANAEIINGGTIDGFIQVQGNLLLTGTNGVYITNDLQADGGTVTIDTKSIAEMTGTTLFDGIYQAVGSGSVINMGGTLEGLSVDVTVLQGPQANPFGWTELTLNGPNTEINEWNGSAYVSIETTLTEIQSGGTVDVLTGRDYTTTNTLTIDDVGISQAPGMLNLQAGTVTATALVINGGIVQGFATIATSVANNGTLIAVGGTMDITGSLTGTGSVGFDTDLQQGTTNPVGATLEVNSVSAGQTIVMNGDDILQIDTPSGFAGTIVAKVGDQIILGGVTATSAMVNGGTLVVFDGTQTVASLALSGDYSADHVTASGSTLTLASGAVTGPTISGTAAGQATSDAATITPFSGVVIADPNVAQTETVTVTMSAAANGVLSNLGAGSYNATTGVYTDTGSAATVTADLAGLVFTPTAHEVAPGQSVTTTFTISDVDTGGISATDSKTSVIATAGTVLPTITGGVAGQAVTDVTTIAPFAGVVIGDANIAQTETVTVTLSAAANGTLGNLGAGSYNATTGVYTDTGSAATVTADLAGLVFTPTAHEVAPGQTVTTTFTIGDTDSAGAFATNTTTSVIATASAVAPKDMVPDDFTGDGRSDILYQNPGSGDIGYSALPSGQAEGGWVGYGAPTTGYSVAGVGDFDGNGTADVLYRDNATGDSGYLANPVGGGQGNWVDLGDSSTAYSIVGDGDFTGNGTADLLFQNSSSGDMGVYLLGAGGANTWQDLGSPSLLYSVVGVGDLTGSGKADILFEDTATGGIGFYEPGLGGAQATWVGLGTASTAYSVVGIGDFNGNGGSDILFRDNATGDSGYLAMGQGGASGTWVDLGLSSTSYSVVAVGDFTGNGVSDILFRNNATGDTGYYSPPVGGAPGAWHDLGSSSTAYHVVASPTFG